MPYLVNRIKRELGAHVANKLSEIGIVYTEDINERDQKAVIAGVSCLDYLNLYKKFMEGERPRHTLDYISKLELGRGKISYSGSLDSLYTENVNKFIEYNVNDVELVVELDRKFNFIAIAMALCHSGCVPYEDIRWPTRYLEGAALVYCKQNNVIALTTQSDEIPTKAKGAFVKPPKVGLFNYVGSVADALRIGGAKVNDSCGFHIHAEIADFKHNMAATLAAYWLKIESVILEILPKHRKNNTYAKPMAKIFDYPLNKHYTWEEFWVRVRPQGLDNASRRVALNLCNYCHWHANRRTVELRLPEGTLEGKEVKNWIRFFLTFVDNVRKMPFPESLEQVGVYDAMKIIGLHGENPFLILSKGHSPRKKSHTRQKIADNGWRTLQYSECGI
jgi:hypothetical protein